jgi:hypothetical protein
MPFFSLPGINSFHAREKRPKGDQWRRAKEIEFLFGINGVKGG